MHPKFKEPVKLLPRQCMRDIHTSKEAGVPNYAQTSGKHTPPSYTTYALNRTTRAIQKYNAIHEFNTKCVLQERHLRNLRVQLANDQTRQHEEDMELHYLWESKGE